jgi:hypothetical protein
LKNYNVTTELRKIKTNEKNITSNQVQYDNKKYNTLIIVIIVLIFNSYTYLFLLSITYRDNIMAATKNESNNKQNGFTRSPWPRNAVIALGSWFSEF